MWNFPASPTIGQTFTPVAGTTYIWNGVAWDRVAAPYSAMPAGVCVPFAGPVAPVGTLFCDGSTFSAAAYPLLYAALGNSNVLPDLRGRVVAGRDNMGGTPANRLTLAISGIAAATLGAAGGGEALMAHAHTGSGTTGNENAGHTHTVSGTTSGESVDHAHYVSGYTDTHAGHQHSYDRYAGGQGPAWTYNVAPTSQRDPVAGYNTGVNGAHNHTINFWSGGINVGHTHTYSFTTATESAWHQHDYSFTTANAGAGGSQNVQPTLVLNYIIFTGA